MDDLSLELGMDIQGSRRKVKTDARPLSYSAFEQRNRDLRIDESLEMRTSGNVVRDELLRYDLYLRGGLSQESYVEHRPWGDDSRDPNGQILEHDLRLQAFQSGKVSGTVYTSQLEGRIPRPFLPSLDQTRKRYGTSLTYNDAKLPMSLTWESTEDRINSGHTLEYEDNENQEEDRLNYEVTWQPTENHSLRLEYEYENSEDRYSGTPTRFETQRNLFSLTDTLQFGDSNRHRLETLLRIDDEQGDLARDAMEFSPNLRLQHTDNLFTNYRLQYLKQNQWQLESDTYRGDAGITHLLKNVLTSSFNFYGLQQEARRSADISEWGTIANFNFQKENSLGRFSGNLSYLHSATETDQGRHEGVVIGEAVTFRDPLPAVLAHTDINVLTVIVTASNGLRIFLPGRDYIVVWLGRYAALQRIPTGMILDRETVLVSYTYRVANNYEVNRDRLDFRIQEDFKMGLSPYYAMSVQDEQISHDSLLTWQERNIHRHRVGATYRRANWSFGPEYEYNNDSIDPYQAGHLNGDITFFRDGRQQLCGRANASRFFFDGKDDYIRERATTLIDLGINYTYQIADRLEAGADAMYRFEKDSIFGRTQGIDLKGTLSYRIGLFTILCEVEYDSLDLPYSSDDSIAFWFKVRRVIPVIGDSRR